MLGVNVNGYDIKHLKEAMTKEKLTWRSFADPGDIGQGAIAKGWNLAATPTFYVIDHKGVIRGKWVGGAAARAMDVAIEKLVKGAEASQK